MIVDFLQVSWLELNTNYQYFNLGPKILCDCIRFSCNRSDCDCGCGNLRMRVVVILNGLKKFVLRLEI